MIPEKFNLNDSASEEKLNLFIEDLLGVEKFSPDPQRLETYFSHFKKRFKERNIPIIIVAGTNGKGEVSLLLERYCLDNGLNPYVWNSPHIISARERMSFCGEAVEAKLLLKAFEENSSLASKLSYYEFLFYIFCLLIDARATSKNDILILEVGLGGRLDATNFFDADMAILTSISRDHVEFLGSKLSGILHEKIAVSRSQKILISGVEQSFLRPLVREHCSNENIELVDLWDDKLIDQMDFHERNRICAQVAFKKFFSEVLGNNAAVKINQIDHVWGRPLKMTYRGCQFILLGSHNLDGLRHLAKWTSSQNKKHYGVEICTKSEFYFDEAWLGFSRHNHDDLKQCLSLISESPCIGEKVFLTSFDHPRATPWETLVDCANSTMKDKIGEKVYLEQYFTTLIQKFDSQNDSHKRILLAGSYYFMGSFLFALPADSYQFS